MAGTKAVLLVLWLWAACSDAQVSQGQGHASFALSNALGSTMVLQREPQQAVIWGTYSDNGAPDAVVLAGKKYKPTTDASSQSWAVEFDPQPAGEAGDIEITSSATGQKVVLTDVLFGDVFLCSGQSNMVFSTDQIYNATAEVASANSTVYRSIRLFTVKPTMSSEPQVNFPDVLQPWSQASSTTVGNPDPFSYHSAICWLTGKNIFDNLLHRKVPVGLMVSAFGGTRIHSWSSPDALAKCNQTSKLVGNGDSNLYNAMLHPILKLRFSGAFWLQGESDVNPTDSGMQPQRGGHYYACMFPAFIADLREKFETRVVWPFIWVQLSPWVGHEAATSDWQLPDIRQAQLAGNKVANVGFSTAIDLGDYDPSTNPWGGVHFRHKTPLGPRLAAVADALVYNNSAAKHKSPAAVSAKAGNKPNSVVVEFENVQGALAVRTGNVCPSTVNVSKCGWFEVQSAESGLWYNASAAPASATSVVVSTTQSIVGSINATRYAWADWPVAVLYDNTLPAIPYWLPVQH